MKITADGFGIHTFMLSSRLPYDKFRQLKNLLYHSISDINKDEDNYYIKSRFFSDNNFKGLTAKLYMQHEFARIEIIVNPTDFLEGEYTQSRIFHSRSACPDVCKKLNKALWLIDMHLKDFVISRIDLCVNYIVESDVLKAYLNLCKRSYRSNFVSLTGFDNAEADEHSAAFAGNYYSIELYDKEYEICKRNKIPFNRSYGNVLRIELRLERQLIHNYIQSDHTYNHRKILQYFLANAQDIMLQYAKRCFTSGNYVTLDKARRITRSSDFKEKTIGRMLYVLESKRPIDSTLAELKQEHQLSDKAISRILAKFEKCGINTTLISVRMARKCGDELPSVPNLLNNIDVNNKITRKT